MYIYASTLVKIYNETQKKYLVYNFSPNEKVLGFSKKILSFDKKSKDNYFFTLRLPYNSHCYFFRPDLYRRTCIFDNIINEIQNDHFRLVSSGGSQNFDFKKIYDNVIYLNSFVNKDSMKPFPMTGFREQVIKYIMYYTMKNIDVSQFKYLVQVTDERLFSNIDDRRKVTYVIHKSENYRSKHYVFLNEDELIVHKLRMNHLPIKNMYISTKDASNT